MIPVCTPKLGGKELEYVTDCIKRNWISSQGEYVKKFEKKFSNYCECKHGISTTSGTTALHLALAAGKIGEGDEVIIPSFTNVSVAFATIYQKANPILVDSKEKTGNIDPEKVKEKINSNTKAIIPVHMYGHPCNMNEIKEIADDHNLLVIEDGAEAHGAEYKGNKIGGIGDIGCFSFYGNKIITTGEGGMITTNDKEIAERAKFLKNMASSKENKFQHKELGYNYRMSNVQAAIGLGQVEKIDQLIQMRRKNAEIYKESLLDLEGLITPVEKNWAKNVNWMFTIILTDEFRMSRDDLAEKLLEKGIETRPFFIPMHKQKFFKDMGLFQKENYPIAEKLSKNGMYLPSSPSLNREKIKSICQKIKEIIKH